MVFATDRMDVAEAVTGTPAYRVSLAK